MPINRLEETVDRFERELKELLGEVRGLRRNNRAMKVALVVLAVVVLGLGFLAIQANATARHFERLDRSGREATEAARVTACQLRNNTNARTRLRFFDFYAVLDTVVSTPEGHAFVAQLRNAEPTADQEDVDCNVPPNGLGAEDYP